jgi:hypothetical protein
LKNAIFWDIMPCGTCKNQRFKGMSVLTRATRRNILEDGILHSHHHENLESYKIQIDYPQLFHLHMYVTLRKGFTPGQIKLNSNTVLYEVYNSDIVLWSV